MITLAWGAWLVLMVFGLVCAMARDSHSGYSSVRLSRLFFFLWVLVCALALLGLRYTTEALLAGAVAFVVGVLTFSIESGSASRKKEFDERLAGARRALEEDPNNSMSEELLGDLYSTLEDAALARKHWSRALELRSDAKLREKLAGLDRRPPVFYLWGSPAAHEWRACPACGAVEARLAKHCEACRAPFFTEPGQWQAAVLDRFCGENGVDGLLKLALYLLPVLFVLGALPYLSAWLLWGISMRRPVSLPRHEGAGGRLAGRGALALLLAAGAAAASRSTPESLGLVRRRPVSRATVPAGVDMALIGKLEKLARESGSGEFGEDARRLLEEELAKAEARGLLDKPLDESGVTGRQLRDEAAKGALGPAGRAYLDNAEKKGLLDAAIPGSPGMTYRGALEKAKEIMTRAEERSERLAREEAEAGIPGRPAPEKVIPEAIALLNSPDLESRVHGAQLMCDTRVARHPMAQAARPELLRAKASKDADLSGFAEMALRRLDHFSARRESGAAP